MTPHQIHTQAKASPIASAAAAAAAADGHKRKLEDLELNNTSEPVAKSKHNSDRDSLSRIVDESETKRPRSESNSEFTVSENGHQEDEKEDMLDEESKQPESEDNNNCQPVEGPEAVEMATEETASNDNEKTEGDVPVGSDTGLLSRKMEVPNDKVGVLIGKGGDTILSLMDNSGAKIQIVRDSDADPWSATRPLELVGPLESINKAEKLIKDVIAEADAGVSPSLVARGFNTVQAASGREQLEILVQVPTEKVGLIIGKGGETIRNLQAISGACIQYIRQNPPDGYQSRERTFRVNGKQEAN